MNKLEIDNIHTLIGPRSKVLCLSNSTDLSFLKNQVNYLHVIEYDINRSKSIKTQLDLVTNDNFSAKVELVEPSYPQKNSFSPAQPTQFDSYVNYIKNLKNDTYDSVFINGRDRLRSAKASLNSLKEGGYIFIHDFWERPRYHDMLHWPELELRGKIPTDREVNVNNIKLAIFKKVKPVNISNNNVFLYWHGKNYRLISMLRDLIYKHSNNSKNYRVHLINQTNVVDYVDVPINFYKLSLNHQSDYVRAAVICKYGGIYLDSDTIVMNNLSSLFNDIEKRDGFFIKENNKHISPGVFGSKPNTPFINMWLKDCIKKINNSYKQPWTAFTTDLFSNYQDTKALESYKLYDGLDSMYPVNWDECLTEFVRKPYDNYKLLIRSFQPVVIIVNSVYKYMEKFRIEEIPYMNIPLSYFINKSNKD